MASTGLTADKLAAVYLKMREERAELKQQYEEEDNVIKGKMAIIQAEMLKICAREDADSIKTEHGTIIRSISTRYWAADWDLMYKFINDNQLPQLLERRIAQNTMKTYLEEHDNNLPAGLNSERTYEISVRKPKSK